VPVRGSLLEADFECSFCTGQLARTNPTKDTPPQGGSDIPGVTDEHGQHQPDNWSRQQQRLSQTFPNSGASRGVRREQPEPLAPN
jgi:hypothetical protein